MKTKVISLIAAILSLQSVMGGDTDRPEIERLIRGISFVAGNKLFGHPPRIEFHYKAPGNNSANEDVVLQFDLNKSTQGTWSIEPERGQIVVLGKEKNILIKHGGKVYKITLDQNAMLGRTLSKLKDSHDFDGGEFARNRPEQRSICTIS